MDLFVYKSQWIQVLNSFRVFLSGYMCTEDWVHIAKTGLFFSKVDFSLKVDFVF